MYEQSLGEADLKKMNEKSSKSIEIYKNNNAAAKENTAIAGLVGIEKSKPLTTRKETQRLPKIKNDTITHSGKS